MQPQPIEDQEPGRDSGAVSASQALAESSLPAPISGTQAVPQEPLVPSAEIHALALRYLKDLLRINSSNPPGLERPAIDYVAEVLRENNVPFQLLEGYPGRPNLFAELPGPDGVPAILLSSHVDVVPVEFPEKWKHDPFGGVEEDGMIYGRGAIDMKYKTAYDLAFVVHASKLPRTRPIKLLALSDEEAGADAGSRYVTENHRELIDAEYVFNEVGGFNMRLGAKEILPIQAAEKGFCHLKLEVQGHSMHASIPTQQSAALTLARALVAINQGFEVYSQCDSARVFLETVADGQPPHIEQLFRGLLSEQSFTAAVQAFPDPALRAQIAGLLCHTVTPCILDAGVKVNVTPGKAVAEFDCRLVPGLSKDELLKRLEKALGPELSAASKMEVVTFSDGYQLDVDDPMLAAVGKELETYWRQRFGEAQFAPLLLPASSDNSVYFRAGIKPIGFAPLKFPEGFPAFALAHADDERIPRESFERGLECYFHVIGKLTLASP